MNTGNVILLVAIVVIILYTSGSLGSETKQTEQPAVIGGTDRGGMTQEIKAPAVLYDEEWYQGNAMPLTPGRNVYFGEVNNRGEGNCPGPVYYNDNEAGIKGSGLSGTERPINSNEALSCWEFLYDSMKMDPNYKVYFHRSSGGNNYAQEIDPSITGNIPILNAHVLESYVDVSDGNPYADTYKMSKTAALPYYYWKNPLYVRVSPKPTLPDGEVYKLANDTNNTNVNVMNQTVPTPKITASVEEADNMASTNEGFCISSGV